MSSSGDLRTGPPPTAQSQRDRVLYALREAAQRGQGVHSDFLLYDLKIRQFPTRIFELKGEGFVIESRQDPDTRLVTYFLKSEPERRGSRDWFPDRGRRQPTGLPLFDLAVQP